MGLPQPGWMIYDGNSENHMDDGWGSPMVAPWIGSKSLGTYSGMFGNLWDTVDTAGRKLETQTVVVRGAMCLMVL